MVQNIVIIGGGYAGVEAATTLEKLLDKTTYRILLIEKKSHFYHAIGGLRSSVVDIDNQIMIPYTNLFEKETNRVIQACAVKLEKDYIVLDQSVPEFEDKIVPYNYVLLATGTSYPVPAKASGRNYQDIHENLEGLRQQVKKAKSVLIVGGGSVGIEFAGEIREVYEDKKITLVHSKENVLDVNFSNELRSSLLDILVKNNIQTLFNESVKLPDLHGKSYYSPNGPVETKSGKIIQDVDLVLLAFGNRPATAWLKNTQLGSEIVSSNGYIKVKSTLQVDHPELSNAFVLGDAADLDESKLAYRAHDHTLIIVENLKQLILHQAEPTAHYQKGPDGIGIPFGTKQGAGSLSQSDGTIVTLGDLDVSERKGETLLIDKCWKLLNLNIPAN